MGKASSVLFLFIFIAGHSNGQGLVHSKGYINDYLRLLEIQGEDYNNPLIFHTNKTIMPTKDSTKSILNPWANQLAYYQDKNEKFSVTLISPEIKTGYNSQYARSYNDGPAWNGKGITTSINAGFRINAGPVVATFYPNFSYSENASFPLRKRTSSRTPYAYQFDSRIDWVQRFGDNSISAFHLGQSSIAINVGVVSFKLSTENMWWGPGYNNSILMTNSAPGFPHIDIGTPLPIKTKFGDFEIHSIWGQLKESNYFDGNPDNDNRYIAALTLGYRPSFSKFFKGLSFGISRVLYKPWPTDGLSFGDLLLAVKNFDNTPVTINGSRTNDDSDQMVSFNSRWYFDEIAAEIYFEYVRNDFWVDIKDLAAEPEHGGAFTLGMQKSFAVNDILWRIGFEHTSLATTRTVEVRSSHSVYLHTVALQGYTHKGQLIGAQIGPGSKSQLLSLEKFDKKGKTTFSINRIRFDDDFAFNESKRTGRFINHDVELNFGLEKVLFLKRFELSGKFIYSRRNNWQFDDNRDVNNFQLLTGVKWHITSQPIFSLN